MILGLGVAGVMAGLWYVKAEEETIMAKAASQAEVLSATMTAPGTNTPVFVNAKVVKMPKDLNLAGESVPLDDPEVYERMDKELYVNTYFHSSTIFLIKRSTRWFPQMEPILKEAGIPEDMMYLAAIESGLANVVSPAGAAGYWQLMKGTARELGLEVNEEVDERYDPIKSTEAACKYMLASYEKYGNWTNVAASYNMGRNGFSKALAKQRVDSYYDLLLNQETSRYVFRILAVKEILNDPEKFGFQIPESEKYQPEQLKVVEVKSSIPDLTSWALEHGVNYKTLKRYNSWLRKNTLTIKSGKTYQIKLPA
ncbi:lytic transglycosylase domain-containing protein [Persicobacter sp. CCB-QB2]|uniref:lytic transglycosylase domain-containing protein n=1 Tax=Persicobacter sp. CCB-QB2 TaxID=1561025 RepID=UPI0009E64B6C|nr:lytic transglycosylase domain-containing protein [Persicobacter sp. CCB-QB2]